MATYTTHARLAAPEVDRHPLAASYSDPDWARTVAISTQKGGTGKTTCAVQFAHEAARLGAKVLLIDADPQHNASIAVGAKPWLGGEFQGSWVDPDPTLTDVLDRDTQLQLADVAVSPSATWQPDALLDWQHGGAFVDGGEVTLVQSNPRLQEVAHQRRSASELRLRRALEQVARNYDLVLIDCQPSAGDLTQMAMHAASWVVSPTPPSLLPKEGLQMQHELITEFRNGWRHPIRIAGVIVTMFDARKSEHKTSVREIRDWAEMHLDVVEPEGWADDIGAPPRIGGVWDPVIPIRAHVENSTARLQPVANELKLLETATATQRLTITGRYSPLVQVFARHALNLLRLVQAPVLPAIADQLQRSRLPGVWPAPISTTTPGRGE